MYFLLLISFCLTFNNVVCTRNSRIIGGENADIRNFPYSASFRVEYDKTRHFCGGAIISNQHILTAAQCLSGLHAVDFVVYLGRASAPDLSVRYHRVKHIRRHPEFIGELSTSATVHNDIAVVTLLYPIRFSNMQNIVELPTSNVEPGAIAVVSGWGITYYPNGYTAPILQKASMIVVTNPECQHNLEFPIYDQNVCAFLRQGVGACYGDSGAPLVSNGVLVGISSFVRPCAVGEPDVYTRVYSYIDFIRTSMEAPSSGFLSFLRRNN